MATSPPENERKCLLSIVMPAYNEEGRLPESLPQVIDFVRRQPFDTEVLVVDDGSVDRTADIVRSFREEAPFLSLIQVEHGGKGHAVKAGMLQAKGDYLFLCDSDLSMPIEEVARFLPPVLEHYDVAIASRESRGARRHGEPAYRHVMGRVFNGIVNVLVVSGIRDTQAGFKCFRRTAAKKIFSLQTIKGWGFDVEVLFIARHHRMRIVEVPINWHYKDRSQVRPIHDTCNMLREVLAVRLNAFHGRYD